ncbi:hypothetical protein M433DRAFT_159955 [Acidomyces richmondensis BFW]|nr:hypothetical protein M433DRAFT_159955 [Acidomyces richmondensis BFW]
MSHTIYGHLTTPLPSRKIPRSELAATSAKEWADEFDNISWTAKNTDLRSFETCFGTLDPADFKRLNILYIPINREETLRTEGDVSSYFDIHIRGPVSLAWSSYPHLEFRSLERPLSRDISADDEVVVVDCAIFFRDVHCLAVLDHKRPGVIRENDWNVYGDNTAASQRLGRELRGYAHYYNTPLAMCFDGHYLLILRFRCDDKEDILDHDPDSWLIKCVPSQGDVGVRRALYQCVKDQYHRVCVPIPRTTVGRFTSFRPAGTGQTHWSYLHDNNSRQNYPSLPGCTKRLDERRKEMIWALNGVEIIREANVI